MRTPADYIAKKLSKAGLRQLEKIFREDEIVTNVRVVPLVNHEEQRNDALLIEMKFGIIFDERASDFCEAFVTESNPTIEAVTPGNSFHVVTEDANGLTMRVWIQPDGDESETSH